MNDITTPGGAPPPRHVFASGIVLAGKDVNRIGEIGKVDPVLAPVEEFTK